MASVMGTLASEVVRHYGGRYSRRLGIDVDAGDREVERWFIAATLFGNRIATGVAARTFRLLDGAGIHRITDAASFDRSRLASLLDAGGYARYDWQMSGRLQALARAVTERYGGEVGAIGRRHADPAGLAAALDDLPGWGPVTVGLFLRELRGVWPGAVGPIGPAAAEAAVHLGLTGRSGDQAGALAEVARRSGLDLRDLETGLVRLWSGHRAVEACPGGADCVALAAPRSPRPRTRRIALPGGRTLVVRPIRPGDAPALVTLYAGLPYEDVFCRFFSGRPPPATFVERMTRVAERGGVGLIATVAQGREPATIVAEATCEPLPDGDGELGITVAEHARGWLGPYLLDALLEEAAALGMPNIEADVLVSNRRMLAMMRQRGYAVLAHEEGPAIVRLIIGTARRVPSWPERHEGDRLLVEAPGGRWHGEDPARRAGFEVLACPGPAGGWSKCPALHGQPCPLVAGADVVVDAVPGEQGRALLEAHRRLHPSVPVCIALAAGAEPANPDEATIPYGADSPMVVQILQRLARNAPDEAAPPAGAPAAGAPPAET